MKLNQALFFEYLNQSSAKKINRQAQWWKKRKYVWGYCSEFPAKFNRIWKQENLKTTLFCAQNGG